MIHVLKMLMLMGLGVRDPMGSEVFPVSIAVGSGVRAWLVTN